MDATMLLRNMTLFIFLSIWQFDTRWWKGRRVVASCDRSVRDCGVDGGFVRVVPVASRNIVALVYIHFISILGELAVRDETSVAMLSNGRAPRFQLLLTQHLRR